METTIMENQMEKKMENDMETGIILGLYWGYTLILDSKDRQVWWFRAGGDAGQSRGFSEWEEGVSD